MDFTGERVVPGQVDADLWQEHVSRYEFARAYVTPASRVLDAGCGAGYGSARLAAGAGEVVGIDVAADAVAWSAEHYQSPNLSFRTGDISALPDADASFDLVVAFEVIEHLPDAAIFLKEMRRVLRPEGKLLVSTPNRRYYTDERGYKNPFHTREYDAVEFRALLGEHFAYCELLEQNHAPAITFRAGDPPMKAAAAAASASDEAYFFLAVCSASPVTATGFVYLPESGNVLRERELHIHKLEVDLAAFQETTRKELAERRQWAEKLEAELHAKGEVIAGLQRELEERREWAVKLETDFQRELEDRRAWAAKLEAQLQEKGEFIVRMQREADERTAWAIDLEKRIGEAQSALDKQEAELAARATWAESLNADIGAARVSLQQFASHVADLHAEIVKREGARVAQVTELEQELARRATWAHSLNDEITTLRADLAAMRQKLAAIRESKWYRTGKKLGLTPEGAE